MESILPFLDQYGYWLVFVGVLFAGEVVILAAAFLATAGVFNIWWVIVLSFLGTVLSDSFWYFLGRRIGSRLIRLAERLHFDRKYLDYLMANFDRLDKKILIISKLTYGLRTVVILTAGHCHIPFRRFFIFNAIGTAMWLAILIILGYSLGWSWQTSSAYGHWWKIFALAGLALFFIIQFLSKSFFKNRDIFKKQ